MEVDSAGAAATGAPTADVGVLQQLLQETQPLSLPAPMDIDLDLAAPAATTAAGPAPRLYLVLDTNVLLRRDGLELLHTLRRRFAASSSSDEAGAAGEGVGAAAAAAGISCVAVVPWTVLAELDGLKSEPIRARELLMDADAGASVVQQPLLLGHLFKCLNRTYNGPMNLQTWAAP